MQILNLTPYDNVISGRIHDKEVLCLCDASISSFEIELPDTESLEGTTLIFKKIDSGSNQIAICAMYGQTVDDLETFELDNYNESITLNSHGSKHFITGYYAG